MPPSTEPFIPHTGLDSIGSVSKSGVGTMAGMAFGAAGLGLASMFKDNDEKKEENESKEEN